MKHNYRPFCWLMLLISVCCIHVQAQQRNLSADSSKAADKGEKKFKMGALFVTEYKTSLSNNVDLQGQHYPDGAASHDGFFLRYIRLSSQYQLTNKLSASLLINLADFKNNPQTRVLENAYIQYAFSNYFILYAGQFRPFFGLEDMYPFEMRPSYVWSNQYDAFGKSGWQSFQLGVGLKGSLANKGIPLNYYASMVNGNGKNMNGDNDNHKTFTWRMEYAPLQYVKAGINSGFSKHDQQWAKAIGIDVQAAIPLSPRWELDVETEYKKGTNLNAYDLSETPDKEVKNFKMHGIYVTPGLRYFLNTNKTKALELNSRYEYFEQLSTNENPKKSLSPVLGFMLTEKQSAKLSVGTVIDRYNKQIEGSQQWNANYFFVQFQLKF